MEEELVKAFGEFQIFLEASSPLLDRLRDLAIQHGMSPVELSEHWVAYAATGSRELTEESCEEWGRRLVAAGGKTGPAAVKKRRERPQQRKVLTKDDIDELLEDDLIGQYGTWENGNARSRCGVKRSSEETTPPSSSHKMRVLENGATSTTPLSRRQQSQSMVVTPGTPGGSYSQRKNTGAVVCSHNEGVIPSFGRHGRREIQVAHYDEALALSVPYRHVFQKTSEKTHALLEWVEELGRAICHHHSLAEPIPLSHPSVESAVFMGRVVCDGEGHLNASSVLLEGAVQPGILRSHQVQLDIATSAPYSLFPGQIVAVEGVNNFGGALVASLLYDQGVSPPLPRRLKNTIGGFSAMVAAGPFCTSDSLDMAPLDDIIARVREAEPDILLLMGPFVDINNSIVKTGCLPGDQTLNQFFTHGVLEPLLDCVRGQRTRLLLVPSLKDAHHPFEVYPQPPFQTTCSHQDIDHVTFLPDPCTLSINGVCVGITSTDILFHLSARAMFRGSSGDRMARLASHILNQQSYYPLVPPYRKEEPHPQGKAEPEELPRPPSEVGEVSLDYMQAFEKRRLHIPARPDILLLPSDLKPFIKVVDGCLCINPGHLTRRLTGGTFVKLFVPELPAKPDLTTDVGVNVVHI